MAMRPRAILVVLVVAGLISACGTAGEQPGATPVDADSRGESDPLPQVEVAPSVDEYKTVVALGDASEIVLHGTVTGIRGSEDDDGGEASNPGLPVTFFDFNVTAGLADGSPTSGAIVLGWYDLSTSTFEDVSAIELGDDLVLFLTSGTAGMAPGIDTESSWYWPTNDDNGVFRRLGDCRHAP